jgi:redox-regulated HSP33 family molecular chaperone
MMGSSSDDWILLALRLQHLLITLSHNTIADSHHLQFTVTHALGFSVCTSRLLATDLNTETIP